MEQLTVIGCGTMGHTIALCAAWAGIEVTLFGMEQPYLDEAMNEVRRKLLILEENRLLDADGIAGITGKIKTTCNEAEALLGATFVIEAIPEILSLKQQLFKRLDEQCGAGVILASNTSGLSTAAISAEMKGLERFIITHFWNPAHLVPLVEVVRLKQTSDETFRRTMDLLNLMKKKPVEIKKEVPGFVGNRLQYALFREAQYLLQEGVASKEDIDIAVTHSIGRRLPVTGPLLSADLGGLDVFAAISDYLFKDLNAATESLPVVKQLVDAGQFGYKSGVGFYEWNPEFAGQVQKEREQELIRYLKQDRQLDNIKEEKV